MVVNLERLVEMGMAQVLHGVSSVTNCSQRHPRRRVLMGYYWACTRYVYARGPLGKGIMYGCSYTWGIDTPLDSNTDISSNSDSSDDEWLPGDA